MKLQTLEMMIIRKREISLGLFWKNSCGKRNEWINLQFATRLTEAALKAQNRKKAVSFLFVATIDNGGYKLGL